MAGAEPVALVVGAGLAGLAAAAVLATEARVTVIERLPAPGGLAGFESPEVGALVAECQSAGAGFVIGSTALRWSDGRLFVSGPKCTTWLPGDWLIFAGGSRPATAAESGLLGGRLAGIFAAPVAHHLLEADIVLGRRPVLSGDSFWIDVLLPQLAEQGARPTVVGANGPSARASNWPRHRVVSAHGGARVDRLTIADDRSQYQIAGDALILTGDLRPLRNVDGAVRDGAARTSFIQPLGEGTPEGVIKFARAEAARLLAEMGAER